jgi:hypothetical protein
MDENASPDARTRPTKVADAAWEEAMARARLRRLRARPVRRLPKPIGRDIRKITRKHLKGTGSPLSKLRDDWEKIVGEKLARFCRPEKIHGAKTGRTLTLRVLPAAAALIQHQSETIRQRVSTVAGGNITKLKLVQGPLKDVAGQIRRPPRPLSASERAALEKGTAKIDSPALKAAIVALGRAVLTDEA